jgi:hypothetical protein
MQSPEGVVTNTTEQLCHGHEKDKNRNEQNNDEKVLTPFAEVHRSKGRSSGD